MEGIWQGKMSGNDTVSFNGDAGKPSSVVRVRDAHAGNPYRGE